MRGYESCCFRGGLQESGIYCFLFFFYWIASVVMMLSAVTAIEAMVLGGMGILTFLHKGWLSFFELNPMLLVGKSGNTETSFFFPR